jgi:CheY-like chemotaxis protein
MQTHDPLGAAQRARADLALLESALATGEATAEDPDNRALQSFALALRASGPRPTAAFMETLDRRMREAAQEDDRAQITVLVAHRRLAVRDELVGALGRDPGITVVGEACDALEAISLARGLELDVIVLDLDTVDPGDRELRASSVVAVCADEGPLSVLGALAAGVTAVLPRDTVGEELCDAVRRVHSGDRFLSPTLVAQLARELSVQQRERDESLGRLRLPECRCAPSRMEAYLARASERRMPRWRARLRRWSGAFRTRASEPAPEDQRARHAH